MAILTTSALIGSISGRLGSSIFAHSSSGTTIRSAPRKIKHDSAPTQNVAAALLLVQETWQSLDPDVRKSWVQTAANVFHTNALGVTRPMTPHAYFLRHKLPQAILGMHIYEASHEPQPRWSPGIPLFVFTAGGTYTIKTPIDSISYGKIQVSAARPVRSAPLRTFKNWKSIGIFANPYSTPVDVSDEYEAVLGAPIAGEITGIRIRLGNAAFSDPGLPFFFQTTFV